VEAIIFCGIPGSGKTTLYKERFLETHVRISRDLLRTKNREAVFLRACLDTRQRFVVDKMNATAAERAPYIGAAREAGFTVVAYFIDTPPSLAIARNHARHGRARIPVPAILGAYARLEPPREEEGFDAVRVVRSTEEGFIDETAEPVAHD
jgi:predicted kinase